MMDTELIDYSKEVQVFTARYW